jgi:hypothetical protein
MGRLHEILSSIQNNFTSRSVQRFGGKKRNDLKDSDFLFPENRSFPIVVPKDIKDAIRNFGRMGKKMSYESFIKKLYHFAQKKGSEFLAAIPDATKKKLGLKKDKAGLWGPEDFAPKTMVDMIPENKASDTDMVPEYAETQIEDPYKEEFYEMAVASLITMKAKIDSLLGSLDQTDLCDRLTTPWLQRKITLAEDYVDTIYDFVMFSSEPSDDEEEYEGEDEANTIVDRVMVESDPDHLADYSPTAPVNTMEAKDGLWDNIRKKREREGKNYKPAKTQKDGRPDPEMWKKLTKKTKEKGERDDRLMY